MFSYHNEKFTLNSYTSISISILDENVISTYIIFLMILCLRVCVCMHTCMKINNLVINLKTAVNTGLFIFSILKFNIFGNGIN